MVRVLLAVPLIALDTLVFGSAAVLAGLLDRTGRLCRHLARAWARLLLRGLGVRVEVTGSANVPRGPAVYAANHGSALDIPILFGYLPVDFRIIHKRSLYLIPLVGWTLYLAGHVGIDRGNAFRAHRSLMAAAARIRAGTSLAVFPEGTRSPDARVRPFKRGSFVLALEAQVPVVPLSLAGVKRVAPRGLLTLRPGTVRLAIHPPVATAGLGPEAAESLAEDVRQVVAQGAEAA
ncbi:MAG TPA: lysophospholipid acyltransferase family protein [Vicinamibacteria bacterium]